MDFLFLFLREWEHIWSYRQLISPIFHTFFTIIGIQPKIVSEYAAQKKKLVQLIWYVDAENFINIHNFYHA